MSLNDEQFTEVCKIKALGLLNYFLPKETFDPEKAKVAIYSCFLFLDGILEGCDKKDIEELYIDFGNMLGVRNDSDRQKYQSRDFKSLQRSDEGDQSSESDAASEDW